MSIEQLLCTYRLLLFSMKNFELKPSNDTAISLCRFLGKKEKKKKIRRHLLEYSCIVCLSIVAHKFDRIDRRLAQNRNSNRLSYQQPCCSDMNLDFQDGHRE